MSVSAPVRPKLRHLLVETAETQEQAIEAIRKALGGPLGAGLSDAIELIARATRNGGMEGSGAGRVVVSGVGKSGHIARKIAATLASTGTPAHFVHASDASHGDLGMVTREDVLLLLSNSGETAELRDLLTFAKRFAIPLIAVTSDPESTLATMADIAVVYPKWREACPLRLAPTTSTLQQLVVGDMIAIGLMSDAQFSAGDFGLFHPGGKLGAQLTRVEAIMHGYESLPLVAHDTLMSEALIVMSAKSFGCVGVTRDGVLIGIVTDGDLRRHMSPDLLKRPAAAVMTPNPATTSPDALAASALKEMNARAITSLFVTDGDRPIGILHVHDLLRKGVR